MPPRSTRSPRCARRRSAARRRWASTTAIGSIEAGQAGRPGLRRPGRARNPAAAPRGLAAGLRHAAASRSATSGSPAQRKLDAARARRHGRRRRCVANARQWRDRIAAVAHGVTHVRLRRCTRNRDDDNFRQAELDKLQRARATAGGIPHGPQKALHALNPGAPGLRRATRAAARRARARRRLRRRPAQRSAGAAQAREVTAIDLAPGPDRRSRACTGSNPACRSTTASSRSESLAAELPAQLRRHHLHGNARARARSRRRCSRACATLLKPGGRLFVSTLNRTPAAFALAIVGAEYVARMLPKGTHQYRDFIKPSELAAWLREAGPRARRRQRPGVRTRGATPRASARRTDVNYLACAREARMNRRMRCAVPRAVLFDLDGTLLDSAPDMLATRERACAPRAVAAPMALARCVRIVSKGARAMLAAAFPDVPADERNALDPGIPRHLRARTRPPRRAVRRHRGDARRAGSRRLRAGASSPTSPNTSRATLMPLLGWETRCAVLIGGDTLPRAQAAIRCRCCTRPKRMGVDAGRLRLRRRRRARHQSPRAPRGMRSVVALWGYRLDEDDPSAWQGDAHASTLPHELLRAGPLAGDDAPVTRSARVDSVARRNGARAGPSGPSPNSFVPLAASRARAGLVRAAQELTRRRVGRQRSASRRSEARRGGRRNCTAGRRACAAIRSASCCSANRAPWAELAAALPALARESRERRGRPRRRIRARSEPLARALSTIAATLFGSPAMRAPVPQRRRAACCAERACSLDGEAVPRRCSRRAADAARRTWARRHCARPLAQCPHDGAVAGRLYAALLRERLRRFADGGAPRAPVAGLARAGATLARRKAALTLNGARGAHVVSRATVAPTARYECAASASRRTRCPPRTAPRQLPDVAFDAAALARPLDWVGMDRIAMPVRVARCRWRDGAGRRRGRCRRRPARRRRARHPHVAPVPAVAAGLRAAKRSRPAGLRRVLQGFIDSQQGLSTRARLHIRYDHLLQRPRAGQRQRRLEALSGRRSTPNSRDGHLQLALGVRGRILEHVPGVRRAVAPAAMPNASPSDFAAARPLSTQVVRDWLASERGLAATPHAQRSRADVRVELAPGVRRTAAAVARRRRRSRARHAGADRGEARRRTGLRRTQRREPDVLRRRRAPRGRRAVDATSASSASTCAWRTSKACIRTMRWRGCQARTP